ncbi:MAG: hypothetical protein IJR61_03475 [Clostridia bacterium]|nr:hypothetical protein [Clostridia bacterium]
MPIDLSNKTSYEILGVKEYSTNGEITEAYKALKEKYSEERFQPGVVGNDAAEMLEAVEEAYYSIMRERKVDGFTDKPSEKTASSVNAAVPENTAEQPKDNNNDDAYAEVDALIKAGKIDEAQQKLDSYSERLAEWHYLQAAVYYKKNWGNECKKQMEIALTKDPDNPKYKDAYDKLIKEMEFKNKNFTSGNADGRTAPNRDFDPYDRQMGGNECLNSCCECLACNMLLNCCCNCR